MACATATTSGVTVNTVAPGADGAVSSPFDIIDSSSTVRRATKKTGTIGGIK